MKRLRLSLLLFLTVIKCMMRCPWHVKNIQMSINDWPLSPCSILKCCSIEYGLLHFKTLPDASRELKYIYSYIGTNNKVKFYRLFCDYVCVSVGGWNNYCVEYQNEYFLVNASEDIWSIFVLELRESRWQPCRWLYFQLIYIPINYAIPEYSYHSETEGLKKQKAFCVARNLGFFSRNSNKLCTLLMIIIYSFLFSFSLLHIKFINIIIIILFY